MATTCNPSSLRILSGSVVLALSCFLLPSEARELARPDLTVARPSPAPGSLSAGDAFSITSKTKNGGRAKAARSTTRFYLSSDASRDKGDTRLVGTHPIPSLKPGRSYSSMVELTVPLRVSTASYQLLACADDKRKVAESNEKNNCKAASTTISVKGASTEALLDAAVASGALDAETALVYEVFSIFDDPRLPARYDGDDVPQRSDALVEAADAWDSLSLETQSVVGPFLIPPYYSGSYWEPSTSSVNASARASVVTPWCVGTPAIVTQDWNSLETANGKVKVWWQVRYDATDRALAEEMISELESKIYPAITSLMGNEPKGDDPTSLCDGGSAALDIALVDAGTATTIPDSGCANTSAHMVFPRAGAGWAGPLPYLAHELMHAVQYNMTLAAGTLCNEYAWMREATAQWVQDYVTDLSYGINVSPDDTEFQAAPIYLNATDVSLEVVKPPAHHDYASYLFFFFLARQSAPSIVADVWNAALSNDSLGAVEAVSGGADGLRALWKQFALYNWNQGDIDHYKTWDGLTAGAAITEEGRLPEGEATIQVSVDHLSAKYYRFVPADALTMLEYTNDNPSIEGGGIQAIIRYADGTQKTEDWSDKDKVELCLEDPEIEDVILIFSNGNADRSNTIDFEIKWTGTSGLCCTATTPTSSRSDFHAAADCPVTGTIAYTQMISIPNPGGCCAEEIVLDVAIDVSMKDDGFGTGFLDDGSSYTISYTREVTGNDGLCDYHGSWTGAGGGLVTVGAGAVTEPGDFSIITNAPATRRELLVGVDRSVLDYTFSGSETYSGCEFAGTVTHGPSDGSADDIYFACQDTSTTGYLEFTAPEGSTTMSLQCAHTEGDETLTLHGQLQLPG